MSRPFKTRKKSLYKKTVGKHVAQFSWTLIKVGLTGIIWCFTVATVLILWFSQDLPDLTKLKAGERNPSITIQSEDGVILATYGDLYEDVIRVEDLPHYVPQALIAVEDRRFYYHFGFDFVGLIRAAYANYKAHRVVQGGSTITQQLAKTLLFAEGHYNVNDRSVKRKIQELILALWLEWKFKKDQILTLYLNRVYLGSGAYGIDAAARRYFNKSARQLTVFEAAVIAGLLKAPSKYSPAQNPKRAADRARVVLQLMVEAGFIRNFDNYLEHGERELSDLHSDQNTSTRFFTDWIYETIPQILGKLDKDLIVVTTLDTVMQRHAEQVTKQKIDEKGQEYKVSEVAFLAMSSNGSVKAMIGGKDYNASQFNRTVQAIRQPGSAFKTIIYLAAMENGYNPDSIMDDSPIVIGKWAPSNYKWQSRGQISLREAFAHSVNSVSIRLTQAVSPAKIAEAAKRLGITSRMIQDISISLGACETNLLELTTAFATFANQGKPVWPYGITLIKNKAGEVLYRHESTEEKPIISPQALSYMRELLRSVVATGSGRATNIDETVAGKTGSNGDRDAWFFGYRETPNESADKAQGFTNVIVGVWVGNDDNKPMAKFSTGGRLPTQIAAAFLKGPHVDQKEKIEQKIKKLKESKNQTTTQVTLDQQLKGLL